MKKISALILSVVLVLSACLTVFAEASSDIQENISDEYSTESDYNVGVTEEATTKDCAVPNLPAWNEFQHTSVTFFVSVNSLATVSYHAVARSNSNIEATVYFEKSVLGRWERVEIGTNGNKLTNRASGYYISGTETVKVSGKGTYRAVVTFKNSYGSASGIATFYFNNNTTLADVNHNGKVEAMDARLALRFAAGLQRYDTGEKMRSDINCDGELTAADARIILRIAAKLM